MKDLLGDTPASEYIPPFQAHSKTSREAAQSVSGVSGRDRQRVLTYLTEHTVGATDEQLSEALSMAGNTLRPRRRELQQATLIKDSGRYSLTHSGRRATVWVVTQRQSDQVTFSTLMPPI
jgi:transcription initiation factor IIE alpha subunit